MDPLVLKLTLIALMFVLSVICGLLPLKLLQFLRKRAASASDIDDDRRWPSLLLCLVTCFSGGVFLATCFLHLLPEVTEKMQEIIQEYQWPSGYPLAELISCSGFFLVFLIEELVILCLRGGGGHHHGSGSHRHHSGSIVHVHVVQPPTSKNGGTPAKCCTTNGSDDELDERAEMKALTPPNNGNRVIGRENGISVVGATEMRTAAFPIMSPCGDKSNGILPQYVESKHHNHNHHHHHDHNHHNNNIPLRVISPHNHNIHDHSHHDNGSGYPSPVLGQQPNGVFAFGDVEVSSLILKKRHHQNGTVTIDTDDMMAWDGSRHSSAESGEDEDGNCTGIELPLNAEPECCEGPCDGRKEDPPIMMAYRPHAHSHGVRSITLVVALSFHSLIEGLAFGIQDTATSTTALFLGIIIHKCIIIFSTGVQLTRTHAHQLCLVIVTIILVSLMSPIGAGVGVAVQQTWGHSVTRDVTIMFFSGLSVGTFLYVTFFEVLIHERDNEHNNLLKLFAILIGFILMAALRAMEDKHSHGSGDTSHNSTTSTIESWTSTSVQTIVP